MQADLETPLNEAHVAGATSLVTRLFADIAKYETGGELAKRQKEFKREAALVRELLTTGILNGKPDLDLPERQLLWAGALDSLHAQNKLTRGFHDDPIVEAVSGSRFVDSMTMDFALQAGISKDGAQARIVMGPPGSWFYNDSSRHIINLDLIQSLILGGVRDAQTGLTSTNVDDVFNHEDGHNRLSLEWPESMRKLYDEIAVLMIRGGREDEVISFPDESDVVKEARAKGPDPEGIEKEEYIKLHMLNAEFEMRRRQLWNSAEDICVNTFAVWNSDPEMGGTHEVHLADGINVVSTISTSNGKRAMEYLEGKAKPIESDFSHFCHFVNMTFFVENHLTPDTKEGWQALGVDLDRIEQEAIRQGTTLAALREVCHAIGQAQPSLIHANKPKGRVPEITIPALDGSGPRTLGKSEVVDSKELPKRYNRIRNDMIEELQSFCNLMIKKELEKAAKDLENQMKNPKGGKGKSSGKGLKVKGMEGDAPAPAIHGGNPNQDRGKEQKKNGGGEAGRKAQDKAAEKAKTAGTIREEKMDGRKPGEDDRTPSELGERNDKPLDPSSEQKDESYAPGNMSSAREGLLLGDGKTVRETASSYGFMEAVAEITASLKSISRLTRQTENAISDDNLSLVPKLSGGRMFNRPALNRLQSKLASNTFRPEDAAVFNTREEKIIPCEGDIVIMVDGSGSMGGTPLEIAMKTAELIRQSGEGANYRVFVTMWGDNKDWSNIVAEQNPYLIAEPGMDADQVQRRMETVLKGLESGTELAPGFPNMLNRIGVSHRKQGVMQGRTHFLIISDCGIADPEASRKNMEAVLNGLPQATMDIVLLPNSDSGGLLDVVASLKLDDENKAPKIIRIDDVNEITAKMVGLFEERAGSLPAKSAQSATGYRMRVNSIASDTKPESWGHD